MCKHWARHDCLMTLMESSHACSFYSWEFLLPFASIPTIAGRRTSWFVYECMVHLVPQGIDRRYEPYRCRGGGTDADENPFRHESSSSGTRLRE
jgi:hypothetical protein